MFFGFIRRIKNTEKLIYPLVSDRYKAAFIDAFVMIGFWFAFTILFSSLENLPQEVRIAAYVFSVFLYEPLFVALFGASIGHMSGGLKVRRESNRDKKIYFFAAIFRFFVKVILGIIALFTITKENKGRAIHDMASGSIVLFSQEKYEETNELEDSPLL